MQLHSWLDALKQRVHQAAKRRPARRPAAPSEGLETRALLSVSSLVIGGELSIIADGDDSVEVRTNPVDGVSLQVIENGLNASTVANVTVDQVTSISIRGGAGSNLIDLSGVDSTEFVNLTSVSISGNDGDDTIIGTADRDDIILGGDGNDNITTGVGQNLIDGGDGNDTITSGDGADTVDAGDGHDLVMLGDGDDTARGGDGNDTLSGGDGNDTIEGSNGEDVLNGNAGDDDLDGGMGNDSAMGDAGFDTIIGGVGRDMLGGGDDDDSIVGNAGIDTITGDDGADTIFGGSSRDSITGGAGDDSIVGNSGHDTISGGDGNDSILGGGGVDLIDGDDGDDTLVGNSGSDTLRGGNGMDLLNGGAGSDRLEADQDTTAPAPTGTTARLFATPNDGTNQIVELDPETGAELFRFAAPEAFSGTRDGLSFSGDRIYYINGDGSDMLYEIDPSSLTLTDQDPITVGSGNYDGLASLGGLVFILDPTAIDIHVYDPVTDTVINTLDINAINPTVSPLAGGLAAIANPDRLVVTEAGGSRIHEIDPLTGIITATFVPGTLNAGRYFGAAVINNEIYLGSGTDTSFDVFTRQGFFVRNVALPYSVSSLGGDDIGTAPVSPGDTPADTFDIELRFSGVFTANQQAIFEAAADRWEEVIIGDIPDVFVPGVGQVDDLVVDIRSFTIDGPGGVLGQAALVATRVGSSLPSAAFIEFDTADMTDLESSGQLDDVALHELGHSLGFGAIWEDLGLITGAGGPDPQYIGTMAVAEYNLRFNTNVTGVPVENMGGPGTADVHWRESVLTNELMTGFLNSGSNPLTRLTIAQFADLGYQVDLTAADSLNVTVGAASLLSSADGRDRGVNGPMGTFLPLGTSGTRVTTDTAATAVGPTSDTALIGTTKVMDTRPMVVFPGLSPEKAISLTADEARALTEQMGGKRETQSVQRLQVPEAEPNNTIGTAVDIDNLGFSLDFDADIGDSLTNTSTTIPHLSILGSGDGSYDYYSFTVSNAGDRGIFDIDFGSTIGAGSFDAELFLFDSTGAQVIDPLTGLPVQNDDAPITAGGSGSTSGLDSFIELTFPAPGTYVIGVSAFPSSGANGGITGSTVPIGATYTLQVSIENHATTTSPSTPTPTPTAVFGDILIGGTGNGRGQGDLIFGSPGDDLIRGSNENDTIDAGDGMDSIFAGSGHDSIQGGAGNDTIRGNSGRDTIDGGDGDDSITWKVNNGSDLVLNSEGLDTFDIVGRNTGDTFTINGDGDILHVMYQVGVNTLADISVESGTSIVNIEGRGGNDTFNVLNVRDVRDLVLNLNGGDGNDSIIADKSDLSNLRVNFDAGDGDDTLMGGAGSEAITGGAGNDQIIGGGGNDTLAGGAGDDTLIGQDGDDLLDGGIGIDSLLGGEGNDTLQGGFNNDRLFGGFGDDSLDGGQGADRLEGDEGFDSLFGSDGNDTIEGGAGGDFIHGGSDNDDIDTGGGQNTVRGGDGDDTILGGSQADTINGGDGQDVIDAAGGDDLVTGSDGNDLIYGRDGDDTLVGGDGDDSLQGAGGNDVLLGGDGDDNLLGQGQRDTLAGGEGNDTPVPLNSGANSGDVVNEAFSLDLAIIDALQALPPSE
ncbi:MAG: leishmanolysin-related zinc metalloendopeptidase [Planctomycetota bacterium]